MLIPDRRGNNRVDALRNLVRDPRISLLFMIPGIGNTLRINGRAEIVVDPELCASFAMKGKLPQVRAGGDGGARLHPVPEGAGALAAVERRTRRSPARSCRARAR